MKTLYASILSITLILSGCSSIDLKDPTTKLKLAVLVELAIYEDQCVNAENALSAVEDVRRVFSNDLIPLSRLEDELIEAMTKNNIGPITQAVLLTIAEDAINNNINPDVLSTMTTLNEFVNIVETIALGAQCIAPKAPQITDVRQV